MRAIVIHKAKDLRIEPIEVAAPAAGEVQIRMAMGGICGSDLHYYNHGGFGPIQVREPMILGHEVSGFISALGDGVYDFDIGDLVAVSPSRPCGQCWFCENDQQIHCEAMQFYGSAMPFPHIQGAFREGLVAAAAQCVKANGLTPGEAAMAEPLSVGLHATHRAGEMAGKRVLVTGAGPIGVLTVLAAKSAGAAEIVVTDLVAAALVYAKEIGADEVINITDDPQALAHYQAGKGYFDVLFECSGTAAALASGIAATRPRGVLIQLGLGGDMCVPMQAVTAKELEIRGSFRFHEEFKQAVHFMQQGKIDVKPIISHVFGIEDAVHGFEIANDRRQAMKAQIRFS